VKAVIQNLLRLVLPSGEEYIIYDQTDIRQDPLGNIKRFYRSGLGTYPIPIPRYEMRINEEMGYEKEKVAAGIDTISSREDIMGGG
jgi:hypothetical protein